MYEEFIEKLQETGLSVETGRFQAMMTVSVENDGPVTILLDSDKLF
jgi:D-tyrosyl-tRNA(Tyr) deacylase